MVVFNSVKKWKIACLVLLSSPLLILAESEPKPQPSSTPKTKVPNADSTEAERNNYTDILWDLEMRMTHEYHADVRPSGQSKLDVYVHYFLLTVDRIDHTLGEITKNGLLVMSWTDPRLSWDPSVNGDIEEVRSYNPSLFWTPRIQSNSVYEPVPAYVIVYSSGHIAASYRLQASTPCQFDMTNFPDDQQSCSTYITTMDSLIEFHKGAYLNMLTEDRKIKYKDAGLAKGWNVTDVMLETSSETLREPVGIINVTVVIQRHSSYFHKIFTVPICFLMFIIPMLFLLPPDSQEKLTFGGLLMMMLLYEAQNVESMFPPYTDTMPWLVKLVTAATVLMFVALLLVSIISSVERIGRGRPLPIFIKRYINGKVGPFLGVRDNPEINRAVHISTTPSTTENDKDGIVENEVTEEFSHDPNENTSNNALSNLVAELRFARSNNQKSENWTNFFTIVNRFLAILFLLMAIIIIFNFV